MEWLTNLHELPRSLLGTHTWVAKRDARRTESLEDRVAVLEIELAARQLVHRYAYCYDAGDIDGLMGVYADDCVIVNLHGTFVGLDAIRANYERAISARTVAFHHIANLDVTPSADRKEAWATGYIHNLTIKGSEHAGTLASIVFHLREAEGRWKVCECRVAISGQHGFVAMPLGGGRLSLSAPTGAETTADLIDDLT